MNYYKKYLKYKNKYILLKGGVTFSSLLPKCVNTRLKNTTDNLKNEIDAVLGQHGIEEELKLEKQMDKERELAKKLIEAEQAKQAEELIKILEIYENIFTKATKINFNFDQFEKNDDDELREFIKNYVENESLNFKFYKFINIDNIKTFLDKKKNVNIYCFIVALIIINLLLKIKNKNKTDDNIEDLLLITYPLHNLISLELIKPVLKNLYPTIFPEG